MMKKLLFSAFFAIISTVNFAQSLPDNPEPGKCYVKRKTPDVWKEEYEKVVVSPAHTKLVKYPPKYETITERVVIKDESKKLILVPPVWKMREVTYDAKENHSTLKVIEAKFSEETRRIKTKEATAVWEMSERIPDCTSPNPDDCRYLYYKPVPATFETLKVKKLISDATTEKTLTGGIQKTYLKKTLVAPATVREVIIPAEYGTVKKQVLVEDASVVEVTVPEKTEVVTKKILVKKGGTVTWEAVDCKITVNTNIPIKWDFSSATLTIEAKSIIDATLLPLLKNGHSVVIESHTDMRGSKSDNQKLSDNRARSVVNYLIEKGIDPSQMKAFGYGETRLKNGCSDGVVCNEAQHAENRRTTFRVVNQN